MLTVAKSLSPTTYRLVVSAQDLGGLESIERPEVLITVTQSAQISQAPQFSKSLYLFSTPENHGATDVGVVSANQSSKKICKVA